MHFLSQTTPQIAVFTPLQFKISIVGLIIK